MSVVSRGRRTRYDNIANGSATGPERTVAGDTVTVVEMPGGGYCTSTSNSEAWHSNVERGSSVSEQGSTNIVGGEVPENLPAAGVSNTEERIASSNVAGYTS